MSRDEQLQCEITEAHNLSVRDGCLIVPASLSSEPQYPVVEIDPDAKDAMKVFFQAAKVAGARIIGMHVERLSGEDLDTAERVVRAEQGAVDQEEPGVQRELDARVKKLRDLRGAIGSVAYYCLHAYPPNAGVVLSLERFATWHSDVFQVDGDAIHDDDELSEPDGVDESRQAENALHFKQLCREIVAIVVEDDRFFLAKNHAQREYAVREAVKDEEKLRAIERHSFFAMGQVIRAAQTQMDLEVLPKLEADLSRLRASGASAEVMAAEIRRSVPFVLRLLKRMNAKSSGR